MDLSQEIAAALDEIRAEQALWKLRQALAAQGPGKRLLEALEGFVERQISVS